MMSNPRPLDARDYSDALIVQDACNLCGVAQAFAAIMIRIGRETNSTDESNRHPIAQLFAAKIASLSGVDRPSNDAYFDAYRVCKERSTEASTKS